MSKKKEKMSNCAYHQEAHHNVSPFIKHVDKATKVLPKLFTIIFRSGRKNTASFLLKSLKMMGSLLILDITQFKNKIENITTLANQELQEPYTDIFPTTYHFLMTNFCNAKCIFCNQANIEKHDRKELSLSAFKRIVANIPVQQARDFYLSGGGEPLLAHDIFPIIEYINTSFPWIKVHIRTNGLLIKKFAKELSQLNVAQIEISLHGISSVNNKMIQGINSDVIEEGIDLLNNYEKLNKNTKKSYKSFYPAVNLINIREIPELVKKASTLLVDEIYVSFCRFYDTSNMDENQSLFFHQKLYDETMLHCEQLAKSLNIKFNHDPLFSVAHKELPCIQPWSTIVCDIDGFVYPCTAGEVCFNKKVKAGEYYFGNLLNNELSQFWNNSDYFKIRQTCNLKEKKNLIPECRNCQSSICLKGSTEKERHILTSI